MKNNELFQQGDTAWLAQYQFTNVVEQVEFLYAPTSCEQLGKMPNQKCLKDIGISTRIRFYEITVTATDSAGRQGMDTCRVIVVPPCGHGDQPCENVDGTSYFEKGYLKGLSDKSRIRLSTCVFGTQMGL